jgi:hypothetical protein
MKGETRKIYHALLSSYKSTIIPMIRWSFERAGFRLNSGDLLGTVTVNPTSVLEGTDFRELPFDDVFLYRELLRPEQLQQSERRR